MINYILLGLSAVCFIFLLLSFIYFIKQKKFEDENLHHGLNTITFGLIFLLAYLTIKIFQYFDESFPDLLSEISVSIPVSIGYLTQIADIGFTALIAICFLVAVILFKEV